VFYFGGANKIRVLLPAERERGEQYILFIFFKNYMAADEPFSVLYNRLQRSGAERERRASRRGFYFAKSIL